MVCTVSANPRTALITGAAGGIGRALCAAFAAAGYRVIATDIGPANIADAVYLPLDLAALVSNADERARFQQQVAQALAGAPLAVLVNNAARQCLGLTGPLSVDELRASLEVNVSAPLALVTALLDALTAARGTVINIGSVHALQTKPGFLPYAVSKAALAGLTRSLALDLAPRGIRVNEIRPGATATPMLLAGFERDPEALARLADYQPLGRLAEPAEVAAVAVMLASREASFVTGAVLQVDGGIGIRLHDPL